MSLMEIVDSIKSVLDIDGISWVMRAILILLLFVVSIVIFILVKYKDSKKTIKDNIQAIKNDFGNWSKKNRIQLSVVSILCTIVIFAISYTIRPLSSYNNITLLDENGKNVYPIGVDILKQEVIDNITFFTYEVTEKVGDEEYTYPVLYKWEKGKLAERISKSACPHFEIVKDSVIYLNSTTMDLSHGELYAARPDGLNERIQEEEVYDFTIDGEYIYYSYCYDTVGVGLEGHALHRMNLNGKNIVIVAYELTSPVLEGSHYNITIEAGWAIYDNYKIELGNPADGLEKVVLLENTDDEWIYYTSNQLIKAKPGGSEQIVLDGTDDFWYQIDKIDDNWIYYQKGNDIYKIDFDGNNKTKIGN